MLSGMTSQTHLPNDSDDVDCCSGPNLEWLLENSGPDEVASFLEKFAGTRFYIPKTLSLSEKNDSCAVRLIKSLGWRCAGLIVAGWARIMWSVPVARTWRVHYYYKHGLSNGEIALKVGCHRRTVVRALAQPQICKKQSAMLLEEKS